MRTRKVGKRQFQLEPLEGRIAPGGGFSSQPLPDLVVRSVQYPSLIRPGTRVDFLVTVQNIGKAAYPATIAVTGGGNVTGVVTGGLRPGEAKVVRVRYDNFFVSPGATYKFRFMVDPDNIIRESNESNNLSGLITIRTTR